MSVLTGRPTTGSSPMSDVVCHFTTVDRTREGSVTKPLGGRNETRGRKYTDSKSQERTVPVSGCPDTRGFGTGYWRLSRDDYTRHLSYQGDRFVRLRTRFDVRQSP